ncbi:MAG: U32 family peptidase [Actinobacteria bacterium]|nr:MAG: U32 family peptidase [Actinomycetota bacterium]
MKLRLPAGSLKSLREAVDNGADAVYTGLSTPTNARSFPGLNFTPEDLARGVAYAHERGKEVYATSNVHPQLNLEQSLQAVDDIAAAGADALIATDIAVLDYASSRHPNLRRHLSVIASASSARAINFHRDEFGISCAVLPRVISVDDIRAIRAGTDVELEVFAFGVL